MESDEQKGAPEKASRRITDVGGTRGGFGEFVLGLLLLALGAYLLMARVVVTSGARSFFGDHSIGVALIPLFAGIALLFANARSIVGWVLTGLATALAYAMTRVDIPGKRIWHFIVVLPTISPPILMALGLILLYGRRGLVTNGIFGLQSTGLGQFLTRFFGDGRAGVKGPRDFAVETFADETHGGELDAAAAFVGRLGFELGRGCGVPRLRAWNALRTAFVARHFMTFFSRKFAPKTAILFLVGPLSIGAGIAGAYLIAHLYQAWRNDPRAVDQGAMCSPSDDHPPGSGVAKVTTTVLE